MVVVGFDVSNGKFKDLVWLISDVLNEIIVYWVGVDNKVIKGGDVFKFYFGKVCELIMIVNFVV